jgi:hypothetical protein
MKYLISVYICRSAISTVHRSGKHKKAQALESKGNIKEVILWTRTQTSKQGGTHAT